MMERKEKGKNRNKEIHKKWWKMEKRRYRNKEIQKE